MRTMRIFLGLPTLALLLMGMSCQTVPVNRPCGVITDSLQDVRGTTPEGDLRISQHFERGVAASCWKRVGPL